MENNKNHIELSEDGSSFFFVFVDSSGNIPCYSKAQGLKIAMELSDKKRITTSEYIKIKKEIMRAKNLPWCEPEKKTLVINQDVLDQIKKFFPEISEEDDLEDIVIFLVKPFDKAFLKMCVHNKDYGRIYFKNGYTEKINRKIDAFSHLVSLKKDKLINDEEFISIQKEIEESPLR